MARQLMGGGGGEESPAKTASPPRYDAPRRFSKKKFMATLRYRRQRR
jgi:hypothetical protein